MGSAVGIWIGSENSISQHHILKWFSHLRRCTLLIQTKRKFPGPASQTAWPASTYLVPEMLSVKMQLPGAEVRGPKDHDLQDRRIAPVRMFTMRGRFFLTECSRLVPIAGSTAAGCIKVCSEIEMLIAQQSCERSNTPPEPASATKRGPGYWGGFGVGLFVLMLAIFYWGLHYRLQQYESARRHSGAAPLAKMWLGDRSSVSAPVMVRAARGPAQARDRRDFTDFNDFALFSFF